MSKYPIGVDFGTLSARAILMDVNTGDEVAVSVYSYAHEVMEEKLPCGKKLPFNWALQHPKDYLEAFEETVSDLVKKSKVAKEDVVGIGIDFTSSTSLPVKKDGTPLCFLTEFAEQPHSYVKLWKHHSAQPRIGRPFS